MKILFICHVIFPISDLHFIIPFYTSTSKFITQHWNAPARNNVPRNFSAVLAKGTIIRRQNGKNGKFYKIFHFIKTLAIT